MKGGIVMDRLIVGARTKLPGLDRIVTDVTSVSSLAQRLKLSRTQLGPQTGRRRGDGKPGLVRHAGKIPAMGLGGFQA